MKENTDESKESFVIVKHAEVLKTQHLHSEYGHSECL
jgi:hypothetical protein